MMVFPLVKCRPPFLFFYLSQVFLWSLSVRVLYPENRTFPLAQDELRPLPLQHFPFPDSFVTMVLASPFLFRQSPGLLSLTASTAAHFSVEWLVLSLIALESSPPGSSLRPDSCRTLPFSQ